MMRATTHALLLTGILAGQDRAAATQARDARPAAASEPSGGGTDLPDPARTYDSGGRRDPFLRPSPRSRPDPVVRSRPRGLAGVGVDEVALRGLVRLDDSHLAILETDHGTSYVARGGEELFDGYVQTVTAGGVVIVVDGPGGAARAVRLTLRPSRGER